MTSTIAAFAVDEEEYEDECIFFACYLTPFSSIYDRIHIPLSSLICIFGCFSNVINVIILTRKEMRTPINVLLTGLSTAQFLLALNYLIFLAIEQLKILCYEFPWSYGVAVYRFFNVNLNIVFHTVAFAHTIVVAIFRYGAIRWPIAAQRTLLRNRTALYASLAVWHIVPILCIPVFLSSKIGETMGLCQLKHMYDLNYSKNAALVAGIFWMFGIVLKLIPSLVLSIFLILLIKSLRRVERRRQIGFSSALNYKHSTDGNCQALLSTTNSARNTRMIATQRTTRMLIAIMILCVSVEFPHGLLNLCTAIYGEKFGIVIYDHLGSVMEMLTLFYSSVSFTLYCAMSNDFQNTFKRLFMKCKKKGNRYELEQSCTTSL